MALNRSRAVVGRQDAADAVALAGFGQRHLTVDDHVRAALRGRHDHVDALGGTVERGRIGQVTFDELRAVFEQTT